MSRAEEKRKKEKKGARYWENRILQDTKLTRIQVDTQLVDNSMSLVDTGGSRLGYI